MSEATKPSTARRRNRKQDTAPKDNGSAETTRSSAPPKNAESKNSRVIALLHRQDGASLDELVAETGWQPHSTRAALTGLRKKGHVIRSDKVDGVRRYSAEVVG
jgi:predicted Rossmann fold nucleotide-binding protein DprA/Smf involved in DNA uptake